MYQFDLKNHFDTTFFIAVISGAVDISVQARYDETPIFKKGRDYMSVKEMLWCEVKENSTPHLNFEYQRTKAQLDDAVTTLMQSLTPAQRVMLDQSILQPIDSLMELQQMLTFDATFSVLNRAWREMLLGERYEPEDFEV